MTAATTVNALPEAVRTDINTALGWVLGVVAVLCICKIIFVGARMAWDHQHTPGVESPVAAEFFAAIIGWILAATTAGGIAAVLLASDHNGSGEPQKSGNVVEEIEKVNPPLEGDQP